MAWSHNPRTKPPRRVGYKGRLAGVSATTREHPALDRRQDARDRRGPSPPRYRNARQRRISRGPPSPPYLPAPPRRRSHVPTRLPRLTRHARHDPHALTAAAPGRSVTSDEGLGARG